MIKEDVQSIAFMMIAHAGSAFDHFYKAIEAARNRDFMVANQEMSLGKEDLTNAHKSQTDLLVAEVKQDDIPFSILMTHAQDHLMMGIFTQRMANEFILLYQEREG